jgi:hypothetical protein
MILRLARGALLTAALFLGACQTGFYQSPAPMPAPSPMDGVWSSTDGVFVANFQSGNFTSRFTSTNEILAQGTYAVAGGSVTMQWMSVATQQRRSAVCAFNADGNVTCNQDGGGRFELTRSAVGAPPPPVGAEAPTGVPQTAPPPQG